MPNRNQLSDSSIVTLRRLIAEVSRLQRKVDGIRGDGVTNTRDAITISSAKSKRTRTKLPQPRWFRITSTSQDGSNKRWVYSMTEVYKSGTGYNAWTDVSNGVTTTKGYNGIEDQNGSSGTYGANIASTNLSGTFDIKPLYTGARVFAYPIASAADTLEWWFVATNQVDGAC